MKFINFKLDKDNYLISVSEILSIKSLNMMMGVKGDLKYLVKLKNEDKFICINKSSFNRIKNFICFVDPNNCSCININIINEK